MHRMVPTSKAIHTHSLSLTLPHPGLTPGMLQLLSSINDIITAIIQIPLLPPNIHYDTLSRTLTLLSPQNTHSAPSDIFYHDTAGIISHSLILPHSGLMPGMLQLLSGIIQITLLPPKNTHTACSDTAGKYTRYNDIIHYDT